MGSNVSGLVERLSLKSDPESRDAASALQAQAAEIERLRARVETPEKGNADLARSNKVRRSQTAHLNTAEQRALNANREVDRLRGEVQAWIDVCAAERKEQRAAAAKLRAAVEVLRRIEPYLDAIVNYADTMDEYEPNRIAYDARAFLATMEKTDD